MPICAGSSENKGQQAALGCIFWRRKSRNYSELCLWFVPVYAASSGPLLAISCGRPASPADASVRTQAVLRAPDIQQNGAAALDIEFPFVGKTELPRAAVQEPHAEECSSRCMVMVTEERGRPSAFAALVRLRSPRRGRTSPSPSADPSATPAGSVCPSSHEGLGTRPASRPAGA